MSAGGMSYGVSQQEAAQMRLGRLMSRETVRLWRNLTEEEMDAYIASGQIIGVTFDDGTVRFPVAQFSQRRDPRIVAIATAAFRDLDPTGLLAASWLVSTVSPGGFRWRDMNVYVTEEDGLPVIMAMARLDVRRHAKGSSE